MTLKQVVAYLNESDIALLDSVAGKQGVSRSKFAASIILDYLMKNQNQMTVEERLEQLEEEVRGLKSQKQIYR